jgi:hypothetical protein
LWPLPPLEGLDDAHRAAAVWAWFAQRERNNFDGWWVLLFVDFRAEHYANLCNIDLAP